MWYSVGIGMLLRILFTFNELFKISRSNPIEVDGEEEQKNEGAGYMLFTRRTMMILNLVGEMIGSRSTKTILKNL
jgi:hypothetical protein